MRISKNQTTSFRLRWLWQHLTPVGAILAIAAILMVLDSNNTSVATLSGFEHRRSLAINQAMVAAAEDLEDIPLVIILEDSWVTSLTHGGDIQHEKAWDIALTKSDGITEIPFEIESFDPVAGKLVIWTKLDTLHHAGTNQFWLYYGGHATADPSDLSVWDEYLGVWHLDSTLQDSGPGAWDLSEKNTSSISGILGEAREGSNSGYLQSGDLDLVDGADSLYGSIWVKVADQNLDGGLMAKGNWGGNCPLLFWRDRSGNNSGRAHTFSILVHGDGQSRRIEGTAGLSADTNWHHVAFTFAAGRSDGLRLYVDGEEDANSPVDVKSISGIHSNNQAFRIGRSANNNSFSGIMDEARLSSVVRGADWIGTEYNNQSAPASFWTIGAAEDLAPSLPVEWESISARELGKRDIEIIWSTAMEYNNHQFHIERSLDGASFQEVGEVYSKGDSEVPQTYIFHDLRPTPFSEGNLVYRIRQEDMDGSSTISPSVEVQIAPEHQLHVYPTAFRDLLRISIPESSSLGGTLSLRSMNGQKIAEDPLGPTSGGEIITWYAPDGLPPGYYFVEVAYEGKRTYVEKVQHR